MASPKTDKSAPDWERIETEYAAGVLSLREIASAHFITEGAIRKRAKRDAWERDRRRSESSNVTLPPADPMARAGFVYVVYLDDSADTRFFKTRFAASRVRGEWFRLERADLVEIAKRGLLV